MKEVNIKGKKYIRTAAASKMFGYSQDYLGQLSRQGRIDAKRVGRTWFVHPPSIEQHQKDIEDEMELQTETDVKNTQQNKHISPSSDKSKTQVKVYKTEISEKKSKDESDKRVHVKVRQISDTTCTKDKSDHRFTPKSIRDTQVVKKKSTSDTSTSKQVTVNIHKLNTKSKDVDTTINSDKKFSANFNQTGVSSDKSYLQRVTSKSKIVNSGKTSISDKDRVYPKVQNKAIHHKIYSSRFTNIQNIPRWQTAVYDNDDTELDPVVNKYRQARLVRDNNFVNDNLHDNVTSDEKLSDINNDTNTISTIKVHCTTDKYTIVSSGVPSFRLQGPVKVVSLDAELGSDISDEQGLSLIKMNKNKDMSPEYSEQSISKSNPDDTFVECKNTFQQTSDTEKSTVDDSFSSLITSRLFYSSLTRIIFLILLLLASFYVLSLESVLLFDTISDTYESALRFDSTIWRNLY